MMMFYFIFIKGRINQFVLLILISSVLCAKNPAPIIEKKLEDMSSSIKETEKNLARMIYLKQKQDDLIKKTRNELLAIKLDLEKTKTQPTLTKYQNSWLFKQGNTFPIKANQKKNNGRLNNIEQKTANIHPATSHSNVTPRENGFNIKSNDNKNQLFFHGDFQFDQDIFFNTKGLTINNGVRSDPISTRETVARYWIRRGRPILAGRLFEHNDFLFTPDFGQGQTRLFDLFIDLHYFEPLSLRVGKQHSLLCGIDRLKGNESLYTLEYSYTTMMAPNREYGLVFYGSLGPKGPSSQMNNIPKSYSFNDWFAYQVGILSGTFDNTNPGLNPTSLTDFTANTSTIGDKFFEGRIFANPFLNSKYKLLERLGVGFAGSVGKTNNQTGLPDMVSIGQNPIFVFKRNVYGYGTRARLHPQGFWLLGPFGIVGDFAHTTQRLTNGRTTASENPAAIVQRNKANELELIYNITQEPQVFGILTPNSNFKFFERGAYGAFQLVFRLSQLDMGSNIFNDFTTEGDQTIYTYSDPRVSVKRATTWSLGLNWFLNKNVRIMTEYDQTSFVGGCSTGALSSPINPGCLTAGTYATASTSSVLNRPKERVFMQRFQLFF